MNFNNLFRIAIKAIAHNKLRSFLTMLGIIIGVASVITMLAIGQGSKQSIRAEISGMGSNMIMINPGGERRGGVRIDPSEMQTLKMEDYYDIHDHCRYVSATSPYVTYSGQIIYGSNNASSTLWGVNQEYLTIRQLSIKDGDIFSDQDIQVAAKVCVLGQTVVDNLFPDGGNPVGKTIRVSSIPFKVVGVLKSKGYNSMGMDQDNLILAPYTTIMKRFLAQTHLSSIQCSAITEELTDKAIDEITAILRENHKLKPADENNFNIRSQQEMSDFMTSTANTLTILLAFIAGISLIVGGIGIMNIMYVSVTERTKEIGLRMSVGARGIDILSQFLIEAILISITGGLIGVTFGCFASWFIGTFLNFPTCIEIWTILLSFAVCTLTGIFFGWYPAQKASNLDPIEAIRYE